VPVLPPLDPDPLTGRRITLYAVPQASNGPSNKVSGHLFAADEQQLLATVLRHIPQNAWDADVLPVGRALKLLDKPTFLTMNGLKSGALRLPIP